jgi:hypothetical protein
MRDLYPRHNSPGLGGCGPAQPGKPKAGCPVPSVVKRMLPGSDRPGNITPRTPLHRKTGKVGKENRPSGKVRTLPGSGGTSFISMGCAELGKLGTLGKVFARFPMCARAGCGGLACLFGILTHFPFLTRRWKIPSLSSLASLKGVQDTEIKGFRNGAVALATFPKGSATLPTFPKFAALNQQMAGCSAFTHNI